MKKFHLFLTLFLLCALSVSALNISVISPTAFNSDLASMNANLGIDASYLVEDFEDLDLVSGLQWSNIGGYDLLPTLKATPLLSDNTPGEWDGEKSLYSGNGYDYGNAVFTFDGNLSAFGIGIGGYNYPHALHLFVDDVDFGDIMTLDNMFLDGEGRSRNGYLWINAEDDESFSKVHFTGYIGDRVYYDHLALLTAEDGTPVPEPGSHSLLLAGLFMVALLAGRKKALLKSISRVL